MVMSQQCTKTPNITYSFESSVQGEHRGGLRPSSGATEVNDQMTYTKTNQLIP